MLKNPKRPPFDVFRHCEIFLNFLSLKGPPFKFFDILQQTEAQRVATVTILKVLRFLSLRYSADFRRSRLVYRKLRRKTKTLLLIFVHDVASKFFLIRSFFSVWKFSLCCGESKQVDSSVQH